MNIPSTPQNPMFTPRTVIFIGHDGSAFVSPTFPGIPKEYMNIGLGQCDKDWNSILQEFRSCEHAEDFYDAAKRVQHYYDLPGWERKVLPVLAVPAGCPVDLGASSVYFVVEKATDQHLTIEEASRADLATEPVTENSQAEGDSPEETVDELDPETLESTVTEQVEAPTAEPEPADAPSPSPEPTEQDTKPFAVAAPAEPEQPKRATIGRVVPGVNDLATVNPEIAAEWNYKKNAPYTPSDISARSQRKMWWKCKKCGHEWETFVHNRALRNSSCPKCREEKKGLDEVKKSKAAKPAPAKDKPAAKPPAKTAEKKQVNLRSLAIKNPRVAKEWHPTKNGTITPEDVNASSSQSFWFKCENGHEWLARVDNRARGANCPYCSGRLPVPGAEPPKPQDFSTGDVVIHKEYGRGVVEKVVPYPSNGDALIIIDFDGIGTKRLMFRAAIRFIERVKN